MADNETKPRRGELRIYLGAAPGVGKTFAMLGEAHRRASRGTDVVVGLVETHGRERTAALLDGLEILPRRTTSHRGHDFGELDTDAVLRRRPDVVVVDELAHSNVDGGRNAKRYQDVEEILAAGIDVLSTVNVQHLASLGDVVTTITGTRQQETVPDEVVRAAEQIELVDITPEALRRRLAHGNVYAANKIDAALGNYFRPGNLIALRELALLWVADQVDVALQRYREQQQITDTWETRERVVVAITAGPESETLVRRARRVANRAGGDLHVVHVLRGDGLYGATPVTVGRVRRLADEIGATFHTVVGEDVPTALLEFARGVNATQLVLGTSRRSRMARLFDEGIGAEVVRASGKIDVHMVTHEAAAGLRAGLRRSPLDPVRRVLGWVLAVLAPAAVTGAGLLLSGTENLSTFVVGYVLATVIVALVGGLGPALVSAVLGGVALNFFFVPPVRSLTVATPQNIVTLVVMIVVAVLVALVVDRAARRAVQAARARTEAALLASYARILMRPHPLPKLLGRIAENFGQDSAAMLERTDGAWHVVASTGVNPCGAPDAGDVDVPVAEDVHLVLRGRPLAAADRTALEAAAGQALFALRQQRTADEAARAKRKVETTELRTALLSAVGHDLRTPLTSIKAAIGSLRDPELALSTADTEELRATIEESADRLTALVDNLLDSSRLATGTVTVKARPVGYDEAVAHALFHVDERRLVDVDVDETLPAVLADPGLLERVVANLIDNALRHGRRAGAAQDEPVVAVHASEHAGYVELRVVDRGAGLPKGSSDAVFAPFQRLGDRDATPGVGLGLSVARGFTEAMGGSLRAEDTPGGGLTLVVSLPVATPENVAVLAGLTEVTEVTDVTGEPEEAR